MTENASYVYEEAESPRFMLAYEFFIFTQPMKTSGVKVRNAPSQSPLLLQHFPFCPLYSLKGLCHQFRIG
jgi:hypothetical protein